ncbi:hypothetical protein SteCoe_18233 [Stentor coeruleus]|uniref:Uncharacterized protein n=1 Tax=Stentor coeruleus TaxID=5963 RepID=A0A1R2BX86_9CILI|nr:hypothetical protein SteCoe_18233 [Stentor coeruleus]
MLSLECLIEHCQALSFIKDSLNSSGESWNSSALDFFEALSDSFLIPIDQDTFKISFIISSILITLLLLLYLIFNKYIHNINKDKLSLTLIFIQFLDHIILGIGYIIILKIFLIPYGCNENSQLIVDTSINCWTNEHLFYMQTGYLFASIGVLLVAGISTVLRAERKGVEKPFGNDLVFPSMYKILDLLVVSLLSTIGEPYVGICFIIVAIGYLGIFEAYEDLYVGCLKMACLFGLLWGFVCAEIARKNGELASQMVTIGWGISLVVGYFVLFVKSLIVNREPMFQCIDK